jgi:hypothetical protein
MAGWLTVFAEEGDEQQVDHMHGGPNGVYVCVLCACQCGCMTQYVVLSSRSLPFK